MGNGKDGERMANRTRNIVLRVPVTAEERALIEKKMQQMWTRCFSVYVRKMLVDGHVIKLDYSDIKAPTCEVRRIAVSLPGSYGHSAYTQNRYFQCGR